MATRSLLGTPPLFNRPHLGSNLLSITGGGAPPSPGSLIAWHDASLSASMFTSAGAGFPFNSSGPYASLSSASADFATGGGVDFAWAGWVLWSGQSGLGVIAGKGAAGGANYEWALYVNFPGSAQLTFQNYSPSGTNNGSATWGATLTPNTWYHVAIWRTGGNAYISVNNGTPVSGTVTATTTGTSTFRFGNFDDAGEPFRGNIGPNGYWSRALTQGAGSDLAALYNGGVPVLYSSLAAAQLTSLVAYYDFDTTAHLTADRTGNAHTLTNSTSPAVVLGAGPASSAISSGAAVSSWTDQSGNGHTYAPPAGNAGLVYTPNYCNGLPMLVGDEATRMLACDPLATLLSGNNVPFGCWIVLKNLNTDGDYQDLLLFANRPGTAAGELIQLGYDGTQGKWDGQEVNTAATRVQIDGGTPDSGAHVIGLVGDATNLTIYLDGAQIAQHARPGGAKAFNMATLGMHRDINHDQASAAGSGWSGGIGQVLIYGDATNPSTYLKNKWGTP